MTSKTNDAADALRAIEKALPNIRYYLCNMLRQENLSLEAEALRARYEAMFVSLEKACHPPEQQTRHSIIGVSPQHEAHFGSRDSLERPATELSGYLLWEDNHQRWQRKYCSLVNQSLVISDSPDDSQGKTVVLNGASVSCTVESADKDLCFSVNLTGDAVMVFAAYSDEDYNRWVASLEQAIKLHQLEGSFHSRDFSISQDRIAELDEDHYSDSTIYEDIDELVQQFDATMNATVQQMHQMSPNKKTKGNFFFTQQKDVQKMQLEAGDYHHGYLHKRSGSSWRKKWCTLKGCVFSYRKSKEDSRNHEYILLKADVALVKDVKRSHTFKLACKGVEEMFFAAASEDDLTEWMTLLTAASKRGDEFPMPVSENGNLSQSMPEGIYNVPRSSALINDLAGIYDVPRSIPIGDWDQRVTNPFDLYDIPRHIDSPTDTIYDYPLDLDLDDMEIYDYPPDVSIDDSEGRLNKYESRHDSGSGSSTPASGDGTSTGGSNRMSLGSFEDLQIAELGDGFRSLPLTPSSNVESFLSKINQAKPEESFDISHVNIKGSLYRKERLKWTKYFCLIRNNFLECHRSSAAALSGSKPVLKLFLVGSEVAPLLESKRLWAFQLKHARREGVLLFAADTETDYKQWIEAFKASTTIEVQKVNSMEQIRIQDSDLKREWRSLEKGLSEDAQEGVEHKKKSRKSWVRSHKRSKSGNSNVDHAGLREQPDGDLRPRSYSNQVSNKDLAGLEIASSPHRSVNVQGHTSFKGYLRVKTDEKWSRLWCVFENKVISCYTSQRNLTLVYKVLLMGSTITRADQEIKKKFSIRVWNSDSRICYYFNAMDEEEYSTWFKEITDGAEHILNESTSIYYYPSPGGASPRVPPRHHPTTGPSVTKEGSMKKHSDKGTWNDRYCKLRDKTLYVYYSSSDQTPITVIAVQHCTVTRSEPRDSQLYVLNVNVMGGKVHVFSCNTQQELDEWMDTLQDCKIDTRTRSKADDVPASSLSNPIHAGYCDVKLKSIWVRYWCVASKSTLYMYHNQESTNTVATVNLPGYEVAMAGGRAKKPFSICLSNPGSTLWIAALDQIDMRKWFMALDSASKDTTATSVSTAPLPSNVPVPTDVPVPTNVPVPTDVPLSSNVPVPTDVPVPTNAPVATNVPTNVSTNVPVPANVPVSTSSVSIPTNAPTNESMPTSVPTTVPASEPEQMTASEEAETKKKGTPQEEYLAKKSSILAHLEKKVQKTKKVSQNTEQNLKRQQKQLTSLKEQFTEYIKRMEASQNPSDQKKAQEMKVKLKQVSKILPYLEKYISVNKQAEAQTMNVLRESCVVKLRELDAKYSRKGLSVGRQARLEKTQSLPSIRTKKRPSDETDTREIADRLSPIPDQPILTPDAPIDLYEEPAYAPIQPIKPKDTSDEHYTKLHPNKGNAPTEQYAELEFQHSGTVSQGEAPTVEYSTLHHHSDRDAPTPTECNVTDDVMGFSSQGDGDHSDGLASTSNTSVDIHQASVQESVDSGLKDKSTDSLAHSPPPLVSSTVSPLVSSTVSSSIHDGEPLAASPLTSPSKCATPPPVKAKPRRSRNSAFIPQIEPQNHERNSVEAPPRMRTGSLAERMKAFQHQ